MTRDRLVYRTFGEDRTGMTCLLFEAYVRVYFVARAHVSMY